MGGLLTKFGQGVKLAFFPVPYVQLSKRCSSCRFTKPLASFYRQTLAKDGLQSWCKQCTRAHGMAKRRKFYTVNVTFVKTARGDK
jgi:hypothetical protein